MKIRNIVAVCGVAALAVVAGTACSNKSQENKETSSASDAAENIDYGKIIKLGEYKGLKLEVIDTVVTDDEIESRIKATLSMNPEKIPVEGRAVENGDIVNIDFEGKLDGVAFDGGTFKGYDLTIGSGSFIPGFEEQVIGMKKGETKDLDITFPDPYENNPDLAGKATVFTVTLNEIYKETPAELTDAWVERVTMGQQKTVAEYREAIKTEIEKYKKDNSDTEAQIAAMEQVIENSEFELSEEGINKEYTDMKAEYEKMATAYGMDIKQFAELSNMTEEEFDVKLKENAENRAKQKLIIDEIFKKEKMSLEDADYADLEEQTGMAKNDLYLQYGQSMVDDYVKTVKVEQFMVDNATKTIKPAQSPEVVTEAQTKAQTESKADAEETSAEETREQTKSSEAKQ